MTRLFVVWAVAVTLCSPAVRAQVVRQLTDVKSGWFGFPTLDDAGTEVWVNTNTNQFGTNPGFRFQIGQWDAVAGTGQLLTSFSQGVAETGYESVSVSDDGQWIAFISNGDLSGQNHDRSYEVFVMRADGTQLTQLSNDPAVNGGSVIAVAMAGGASKVAFFANTNPLGGNPNHIPQIYVINRDGTGLTQVTHSATAKAYFQGMGISGDGQRITFGSTDNPTGQNADGSTEVFAVQSDGTNLRQLTNSGQESTFPVISGDGTKIAFASLGNLTGNNPYNMLEVFVVNWDGTGMRQLTRSSTNPLDRRSSEFPSITNDGALVVFDSNQNLGTSNADGNFEVWKIKTDGTGGLTVLTSGTQQPGASLPAISGNGNRIAFAYGPDALVSGGNPDKGKELYVMDASGGILQQLTNTNNTPVSQDPDITPDGSRIVFVSNGNLLGTDADLTGEIYRIEAGGTGLAQVTNLSGAGPSTPSIASDRSTIVFSSKANPLGSNADLSEEIFLIHADGTALKQLTSSPSGASKHPVIARNGSVVVFDSTANLTGGNADGSTEIFKVNPDGTGLLQLTSGPSGRDSVQPRVDDSGTWVAFTTNANLDGGPDELVEEIYRIRTDGTGLQRVTSGPGGDAVGADISGSGGRISYVSIQDPLGTNPEHNEEVFSYDTATSMTRQLTSADDHNADIARISRDGAYLYFFTSEELTEDDPDYPDDLYRVEVSTDTIQRVSGLRLSAIHPPWGLTVDQNGAHAAFTTFGNWTNSNPDLKDEVYLVDLTAAPGIRGSGPAPTTVSWDVEAGPIRYDVLRGNVSNLSPGSPGTVSLGPVLCLENDSPDADTAGFADTENPPAGQAFFYLYRGSPGLKVGPGSYGKSSDSSERVAGAGDCSL